MKINSTVNMDFKIQFEVSEVEARALVALTIYGFDAFHKVFYEKLGRDAMKPNEAGLRSLFETLKTTIKPHLSRIDKTRNAFNKLIEV